MKKFTMHLISAAGGSAVLTLGLLAVLAGTIQPAMASGAIWLCNDGSVPLREVDTAGATLTNNPTTACTGVAFDGTFLYVSDRQGDITRRTADSTTILAGGFVAKDPGVCCAEDLAFDTKRGKLWRIDHSDGVSVPSMLRRIDPATLMQDAVFSLPLAVSGFGTDLGGIGVAYDPVRDLLYASFCHAGCSSLTSGIVLKIDPNTGANLGTLFTSSVFATLGLGYDITTDTLWMSSVDSSLASVVRHMSLAGGVLSTFSSGLVGDGLEFIGGFAGTPGEPNCHGKSVSALAKQFGGMDAAAAALGFPSVQALQNAIRAFCRE